MCYNTPCRASGNGAFFFSNADDFNNNTIVGKAPLISGLSSRQMLDTSAASEGRFAMVKAICSIEGCWREMISRGMCLMHYKRWRRRNREKVYDWQKSTEERFWEKVEKTDGCWNWIGLTTHGYGRFSIGSRSDDSKTQVQAHRVSYEWLVGPIPEGHHMDHLCRNRRCVNPNHLEPVLPRENALRGDGSSAVNAKKTHCPSGHEYTPENTTIEKRGARRCRACGKERYQKWKSAYK